MPTIPPIDPSFLTTGTEWSVGPAAPPMQVGGDTANPGAFANVLQNLTDTQTEAAQASQALATGTATDPTSVVLAVERARLSMQLAGQVRTKAVEAFQDIFHTQV